MAKRKANVAGVSSNLSSSISKDIANETKETNLPLNNRRIGISVSDSEEFNELGYSKMHQKDITIEITRYLIVNGAHLVYGGDLRQDGYTYAFSELVFQYRRKEEDTKMHYTNYFGWPIHLKLENSDEASFKKNRVKVIKIESPSEVPKALRTSIVPPNSTKNCYYWAKSMTKMRTEMINNCDARIFIGGKLSEYRGFYPGIIEEAYLSVRQKQPIFLVGTFGGATSIIIRAVKGENVLRLVKELIEWYPALTKLYDLTKKKKDMIESLNSLLASFRRLKVNGLAKSNGLSIEQNEILFETKYFNEMIFHILTGLQKSLGK